MAIQQSPTVSPLRQKMSNDMSIRGLSEGTQKQYISACLRFATYFGKSPERLGLNDIKAYQVHLVRDKKVAWSTLNIVVCALRFLYLVTLGKDWAVNHIPYAKMPKTLPEVLSLEEVAEFLEPVINIKHRAMLMTAYACGLRLMEVCSLRVTDIDSKRMVVRVKEGKGKKDRYVMLSPLLLAVLREYWKLVKPKQWLFPGAKPDQHITGAALVKVCARTWKSSGLKKRVTVRTLRHTFATHLLECEILFKIVH